MQDRQTSADRRKTRAHIYGIIDRAYAAANAGKHAAIANWLRETGPRRRRQTSEIKERMLRAYMVAHCVIGEPVQVAEYFGGRRDTLKRWFSEIDATRVRWADFDGAVVTISESMAKAGVYGRAMRPMYDPKPAVTYIVTSYKYEHDSTYDAAKTRRDKLQRDFPEKTFRIMKVLNVSGDATEAAKALK